MLSLGSDGYRALMKERKENYGLLREKLEEVAARHGERVLATKNNPISMGEEGNSKLRT